MVDISRLCHQAQLRSQRLKPRQQPAQLWLQVRQQLHLLQHRRDLQVRLLLPDQELQAQVQARGKPVY